MTQGIAYAQPTELTHLLLQVMILLWLGIGGHKTNNRKRTQIDGDVPRIGKIKQDKKLAGGGQTKVAKRTAPPKKRGPWGAQIHTHTPLHPHRLCLMASTQARLAVDTPLSWPMQQ